MIIIYLLLIKLTGNIETFSKTNIETFCETDTDSDYKEYQNVLNNSQFTQVSQMIRDQSTQILSSAGGMIPGPKGNPGPPGVPGSKYVASGLLLNNMDMVDNKMVLNNKDNTTINTNNIWYLLEDGSLINKKFNDNVDNNNIISITGGGCLNIKNDKLILSNCTNGTKWTWDKNGRFKSGTKCLTNNNGKAIISKCNDNQSLSTQKWILN